MKVSFVLPSITVAPIGGYQVIVEYANSLARKGHHCMLVVPVFGCFGDDVSLPNVAFLPRMLSNAVKARFGLPWAELDPGVKVVVVPIVSSRFLPAADVTVATAWQTAKIVFTSPPRCGTPIYFIQHYETWGAVANPGLVDDTWRLPMQKAVIANWLLDIADKFGERSRTVYTPNGIDRRRFRVVTPISERNPLSVGMLVHGAEWKGTQFGLEALTLARAQIPELEIRLYGALSHDFALPDGAVYFQNLTGAAVPDYFNSLAIFLHPSLSEGWPLPPMEAMACGTAVVAADNPGVLDYSVPDETAVVVPRGSASALAAGIIALATDSPRRVALAEAALAATDTYDLEVAASRFETVMRNAVQHQAHQDR
jgi:glycosyltransferase involved in cell wall biosynthesis